MDLALDSDGDLDLGTDDLVILSGADAIVQHIQIRMLFFLRDWFLDVRIGIPWFEAILRKAPNLSVARRILRTAIITTPGVSSIEEFVFDYTPTTRALSIDFRATSVDGEPLEFTDELILPVVG